MITKVKSPSKQPSTLQSKAHTLIDRCFQLSTTDKIYLKKKHKQSDPALNKIFTSSSNNLQTELKKYLAKSRNSSLHPRQKSEKKDQKVRFRLPDERAGSARGSMSAQRKIMVNTAIRKVHQRIVESQNKSPQPRSSTTLFASNKNRLKFKNQIKQLLDPISTKPLTCVSPNLQTANPHHWLQTQLQPVFISSRLIDNQLNKSFEASSIVEKENRSVESSFKIFDQEAGGVVGVAGGVAVEIHGVEIPGVEIPITIPVSQQTGLINELKGRYAEDILALFFKPYGRDIIREEFVQIMMEFMTEQRTFVSQKAIQIFAQRFFKTSLTLNPRTLGQQLSKICPSKPTKTKYIFNSITKNPTLSLTDIYSYFSNFPQMLQRILKKLFQNDLQMLVLQPESYQSLTYWDLILMEESLCWEQLWGILTTKQ